MYFVAWHEATQHVYAAKYKAEIWFNITHMRKIDKIPNNSIRMITGVLKFLLHHIHSLTKEYEKILNNQEPPIDYPIKNANKKVFAQVNFQPKQIKNMLIKY